ncbi:MAG: hypothetical protein K0Q97_1903 [Bacillota bacterium]|jgi:hypothetical protein|nr:hypothetical protein [Bacillota bacterium]
MFIEAIILGIIIGLIRHGRVARLTTIDFNFNIFIYISAVLYFVILIMNLGLFDYNSNLYSLFLTASYVMLVVFLILNISIRFMFIPLIGLISNLICFFANNFKFPISTDAALKIYGAEIVELLNKGNVKFFIPAENASLSSLGNVINLVNYIVVSPGDIIIFIGIVLIVQSIVSDRRMKNKSKITFSKGMFK